MMLLEVRYVTVGVAITRIRGTGRPVTKSRTSDAVQVTLVTQLDKHAVLLGVLEVVVAPRGDQDQRVAA
jgi:uncharacterized protein with von Willebrand factor type A (vWA) domain